MKRLLIFLLALIPYEYIIAQFIIAGDSTAQDILYKRLDKSLSVAAYPGGPSYSDEDNYYLDINNDGTDDLEFIASAWGHIMGNGSSCSIGTLNGTFIRVTALPFLNDSNSYVSPLEFLDTIQADNFWYASQNEILLASYYNGPYSRNSGFWNIWNGLGDRFIGVNIKIGEQLYYGWVQMRVYAYGGANFYLTNCAIMRTNSGISDETRGTKYKIYPVPVSEKLVIEQESTGNGSTLTLFNTNANLVLTMEIKDLKTILDFSNYESGLYTLRITDDDGIFVKKIIKE